MTARKPKSEHKKSGQPTKYNAEVRRQLTILAKKGFTDVEMAEVVGVDEQTITNWKHAHPKFFGSIRDWKDEADHQVERSLFERAKGFRCKDTKFASHEGEITDQVEYTKHYPPDPTSMIFWLKNRQRHKWSDRKNIELEQPLEELSDEQVASRIALLMKLQGPIDES